MPAIHAMLPLLEPYEPRLELNALVEEVNRLFHEFEACYYDQRHPDVFERGAPLWREMVEAIQPEPTAPWRVLDFGCGTGFASLQLLANLSAGSVHGLTCYDLSPSMLAQARLKVTPRSPTAVFTDDLGVVAAHGPYNMLATNGVLHHLPDPLGMIRELGSCLTRDAVWLAGHEPSCRFYQNPACLQHFKRFQQARTQRRPWGARLGSMISPNRLSKWWNRSPSPKKLTAKAAVHRGLFGRQPPPRLIDRLVDFHVAHSLDEANSGRGFDYLAWEESLRGEWQLRWVKTFAYMGPTYEGTLSPRWQTACRELAAEFPHDGANFSTVWRRK